MAIVESHGIEASVMIKGMLVEKKASYVSLHLSLLVASVLDMMYFLLLESQTRASAALFRDTGSPAKPIELRRSHSVFMKSAQLFLKFADMGALSVSLEVSLKCDALTKTTHVTTNDIQDNDGGAEGVEGL